MRDVLPDLRRWWESGGQVGVGTVVGTYRSAPRPPGASMLVGPDGTAVGSVSGGCVEGAVYEQATAVRDGARPALVRYGVSDDDAFAVGLTCGGIIDIFTQEFSRASFPEFGELADTVEADAPVALATVIEGTPEQLGRHLVIWPDRRVGDLGSSRVDDAVTDDARGLLASGRTSILTYGPDGERLGTGLRVFVASFAPAPRMLVFGAIDFAAAVAKVGVFLGYRVTVCDARPVFATPKRFPDADEVVVDWPHRYLQSQADALDERTVICVLTHDPKFDIPVLAAALALPVAYVGAMGSRRTHAERAEKLLAAGVTPEQLQRLFSPIGLDLGARTPEETAVSIAAEIIAHRWAGGGRRLSSLDGAIHREPLVQAAGG
ncbi:xanthine dehydrogenase accessory factor [Nakamurella panacisegetis]|uniref:Xanthine dehydrogenase accessory factor n=1 Tax=Nakamurella panacisegetis TaxID=1090615 RepID=A0A1H0J734_9ACTN|nr:XdhC/CoxI family protein [Nakamurella panacisegetis]SDO39303.1 xanthine dehydrogenase accessory factor [Nakamurella panacisegetis]